MNVWLKSRNMINFGSSVEEIVKKNSANSERVLLDQNVGYIGQEITGFDE